MYARLVSQITSVATFRIAFFNLSWPPALKHTTLLPIYLSFLRIFFAIMRTITRSHGLQQRHQIELPVELFLGYAHDEHNHEFSPDPFNIQ